MSPQVIQQEAYEYNDPITDFVECLFVNYDFDGAQQKLIECETLIENDYFLTAIKAEFLESARLFIFETYCRWVRGGRAAPWGRGVRGRRAGNRAYHGLWCSEGVGHRPRWS